MWNIYIYITAFICDFFFFFNIGSQLWRAVRKWEMTCKWNPWLDLGTLPLHGQHLKPWGHLDALLLCSAQWQYNRTGDIRLQTVHNNTAKVQYSAVQLLINRKKTTLSSLFASYCRWHCYLSYYVFSLHSFCLRTQCVIIRRSLSLPHS